MTDLHLAGSISRAIVFFGYACRGAKYENPTKVISYFEEILNKIDL